MAETSVLRNNEKRSFKRHEFKALNTYSRSDTDDFQAATTVNYSLDGMYIEAQYPAEPGTKICIKMENCSLNNSNGYHAEVKWCKKMDCSDEACYGIGVQYAKPLSRPVFGFNIGWNVTSGAKPFPETS